MWLFIYMNQVRKLIRETIEGVLISEAAFGFSDVLNNPDIGLVEDKGGSSSIVLYNFKNNTVVGTMSYRPASRNINQFVGVAAEKGYGPLIYELGIMSSFNRALVPTRDGDIRSGAFKVWEKFMDRSDVHKIVLEPGEEAYSEKYENPKIANTALLKIPNKEYKELINRGNELISKYRISPEEVRGRGGNFFAYKYADS